MPLPCPEAGAQMKDTYIILVHCDKNKSQSPKKNHYLAHHPHLCPS